MSENQDVTMEELADKILVLRDKKGEMESALKEINKDLEHTEFELIGIMADREIDSFKRNGINFIVATKEFRGANPETRDALYAKFRELGMDYLFTINAQTLSAKVKEMAEENDGVVPEWLDGLINTYEKTYISVRKK